MPNRFERVFGGPATTVAASLALLASWSGVATGATAQTSSYPVVAPLAEYMMPAAAEVVMARSAAPLSVAKDAEVMVLGKSGYEVAANGSNGFVCMVQRSWANEPANAQFWNPMVRGPLCYNPAAVRSVMPTYIERTQWVLAGTPKDEIIRRTESEVAEGRIRPPEAGAMSFMLSKMGCIGDEVKGPWLPHVMVFVPRDAAYPSDWGANLPGSPVVGTPKGAALDPAALYFIPVAKWSDGTPSP